MAEVLLIGIGPTTLSALESLVQSFRVVGIVRNTLGASVCDPVVQLAAELDIPIFTDTSLASIEVRVAELHPACVVISSYDRLLPATLLQRSRFVNVHYAPLPRYRGRANVNWAIVNNEPTTAITIHDVAAGLDAGNILFQQMIPIGEHDTVSDLYDALNTLQREHLAPTVQRFLDGYHGLPQCEAGATYGCSRVATDGEIDWRMATQQVYARIRALTPPYPGAYSYYRGQQLTIWSARPVQNPDTYVGRVPGRVVARSYQQGSVDVLTGDGVLRIFEVQVEGQSRAPAAQVIGSLRDTLGLGTAELLTRIQLLEQQIARLLESR